MPTDLDGAVWRTSSRRPLAHAEGTRPDACAGTRDCARLQYLAGTNDAPNVLRRGIVRFFFLLLLLASCATAPKDSGPLLQCRQESHIRQGVDFYPSGQAREWSWEEIAEGVKYTSHTARLAPLRWHLVSIDLHCPNLTAIAYPTPEQMAGKEVFTGKTTRQFLRETGAVVAVNATPFKAPLTQLLPSRQLEGLYINRGRLLSPPVSRYSAVCLWQQEDRLRAAIISDQTMYPPETELALGGFFTIIEEGEIQDFPACSLDSRLALGITQDQRYLFILYVEGEKKKESLGLTYEESALVLKAAGAWNALQMDGGGSASLSVRGRETGRRGQRRAANILGFVVSFQ